MYNLPRLNQEEVENVNRPVTNTEIETVSKNLPTNRSSGPDGFTGKLYKTFREELILTLLKLFQKTAEEGRLPRPFYKPIITLIPKSNKDITKKGNYRPLMNISYRHTSPQQNTRKPNSTKC